MLVKLAIAPEVEKDLIAAYDWYEEQSFGLGEEFLRCVDAAIESLLRNPEIYEIVYENYRRAFVRRFPYVIFYEYEENQVIIYCVFHTARNQEKWRQRLSI